MIPTKQLFGFVLMILLINPATGQDNIHYSYSVFSRFHALPHTTQVAPASFPGYMTGWVSHRDRITGMHRDLYGPAITVPGNSLTEKATYCLEQILPAVGISKNGWKLTHTSTASHAGYAHFEQLFSGHKVTFARLTLRFTQDGKLVRIRNYSYGDPEMHSTPAISSEVALATAIENINHFSISGQTTTDWEWFPVPSEYGYALHPAWPFKIDGIVNGAETSLTGYIDAVNGQLLYRDNEVKDNVDLNVQGAIHPLTPSDPPLTEPLANLRITIGGNQYYTDTAGILNEPSLTLPQTATIALRGRWARVRDAQTGGNNNTPSFTHTITSNGTTYTFPDTSPSATRFVNAYYHVNKVHDFMKGYLTNFTALDIPINTNVDVSGNCNAFYNGGPNTLNFLQAGNGCNSFAMCADIVYHEYGHAIAQNFYTWQVGDRMRNGALNEGQADIWALGITHNPVLGSGAYTSGNGFIRRYDQDLKVYPQHIRGEVHADGEIIAGAWWTLATYLGDVPKMMEIFTKTWYDTPDGPNGMEGAVYHDVLISALLNDDDDDDISNGTPNFEDIVAAFARHGIYLLANAIVIHDEVPNQQASTVAAVTAEVQLPPDNFPLFRDIKLCYRLRGDTAWITADMTASSTNNMLFSGSIPGQAAGSIVDYYFALYDYTGATATSFAPADFNPTLPTTQSTIPYQFGVGIGSKERINFDSELSGWQIGNAPGDNATDGIWEQAVPVGSYLNSVMGVLQCQPGADRTPGSSEGKCLVTANPSSPANPTNVNEADVDNGSTSVITPVFDLSGYQHPVISYYRWFSNNRGSNARTDPWQVQIRAGGAPLWFHAVENTFQADHNWRRRIFSVKEYLPQATSVQLKFIATDRVANNLPNQGQGTVEAAVDDFYIYDLGEETGIGSIHPEKQVNIYPNPADEQVEIAFHDGAATGTITLYDITGRQIERITVTPGNNHYTVSTSHIPSGQYLLVVQTGKQIWTKKLGVRH